MAAQAFRYHRDKDIQHLLVIADRVRESPGDLDASNTLAELEPDSEIASLTLSALEAHLPRLGL